VKKLVATLVLLACAAVLVAGCGGGKSRNKAYASSKADYAAALDTICVATDKAGTALGISGTEDLPSKGDDAKELVDKRVDQIDSREPPAEVKDSAESFVEGLKKQANEFGDLVQAAKDGDSAEVKKIQGELSSTTAATSEDARFLGATGCARVL
jgi:hypothetical protein